MSEVKTLDCSLKQKYIDPAMKVTENPENNYEFKMYE
jgi:hypothetical protein